jgi:glycosyltransferase involved in cell wall biosynthesis
MRVALHLGNLRGQGSRQVGYGILQGLTEAGADVAHAWVSSAWERAFEDSHMTRVAPGALAKFVSENVFMRHGLRHCGADCLFSVGDTSLPSPGLPHLLMVQQAFLAYPRDALDFDLPLRFRAKLRLLETYFRAGLAGVQHITVQTDDMKQQLMRRWSLQPERVSVIPSAVDEHVLDFAQATSEPSSTPYLCYLASAGPHKNFLVLAPLMAALARDFPSLRCALTVSARQVPSLCRLAARLGVLDRFIFHGTLARPQALRLLASAQLALIPSKLESFGIPYSEAMALGVPVIAADRPFAREACGEAARYAPANDGRAFADQVGSLLGSEPRREAAVEASKQRFRHVHLGWNEIGRRYLARLDILLATSSRSQRGSDFQGGQSWS